MFIKHSHSMLIILLLRDKQITRRIDRNTEYAFLWVDLWLLCRYLSLSGYGGYCYARASSTDQRNRPPHFAGWLELKASFYYSSKIDTKHVLWYTKLGFTLNDWARNVVWVSHWKLIHTCTALRFTVPVMLFISGAYFPRAAHFKEAVPFAFVFL